MLETSMKESMKLFVYVEYKNANYSYGVGFACDCSKRYIVTKLSSSIEVEPSLFELMGGRKSWDESNFPGVEQVFWYFVLYSMHVQVLKLFDICLECSVLRVFGLLSIL